MPRPAASRTWRSRAGRAALALALVAAVAVAMVVASENSRRAIALAAVAVAPPPLAADETATPGEDNPAETPGGDEPQPTASATGSVTPTGATASGPATSAAPTTKAPTPTAAASSSRTTTRVSPTQRVSPAWADAVAGLTGIPRRALLAYAAADLAMDAASPSCRLGWNTLAAIGSVETGHGTHGGTGLNAAGYPSVPIRGVALDGNGVAAIRDTDGGRWDGDTVWDRAVGPMQFIPSTWARFASDGNADGVGDPNQVDDAALGAARYLCATGTMDSAETWRGAILAYNNSSSYVDQVASRANAYARAVEEIP